MAHRSERFEPGSAAEILAAVRLADVVEHGPKNPEGDAGVILQSLRKVPPHLLYSAPPAEQRRGMPLYQEVWLPSPPSRRPPPLPHQGDGHRSVRAPPPRHISRLGRSAAVDQVVTGARAARPQRLHVELAQNILLGSRWLFGGAARSGRGGGPRIRLL